MVSAANLHDQQNKSINVYIKAAGGASPGGRGGATGSGRGGDGSGVVYTPGRGGVTSGGGGTSNPLKGALAATLTLIISLILCLD
ncbi:hypothetical protein BVC80_8725g17 [Macleaya cordata]|uniref:Uncharacterized protein n=1 Tax=Macleaya cordata TaxID=56857 RepID=A0A200Q8M9_MACCD|nr:hypothetical protein BVC80_8725g17 [Macleaya cordata]